jgi:hypothetical protein
MKKKSKVFFVCNVFFGIFIQYTSPKTKKTGCALANPGRVARTGGWEGFGRGGGAEQAAKNNKEPNKL